MRTNHLFALVATATLVGGCGEERDYHARRVEEVVAAAKEDVATIGHVSEMTAMSAEMELYTCELRMSDHGESFEKHSDHWQRLHRIAEINGGFSLNDLEDKHAKRVEDALEQLKQSEP